MLFFIVFMEEELTSFLVLVYNYKKVHVVEWNRNAYRNV